VTGDDGFYATHTAVAQLKSVPVEDFVQRVGLREMLINYLEEAFTDFRFYILAEWRVKPHDVSLTVLALS